MSKEKQIEEMARVIDEFTEPLSARDFHKTEFSEQFAEALYDAGYSKQSEGEWVVKELKDPLYESKKAPHCSNCGSMSFIRYNYCPDCGAYMKGGERQ